MLPHLFQQLRIIEMTLMAQQTDEIRYFQTQWSVQVAVQCAERGSLLSDIWVGYSSMVEAVNAALQVRPGASAAG